MLCFLLRLLPSSALRPGNAAAPSHLLVLDTELVLRGGCSLELFLAPRWFFSPFRLPPTPSPRRRFSSWVSG